MTHKGAKTASRYLVHKEIEQLDWKGSSVEHNGLTRKRAYRDGSCYFHSIIGAFYKPYIIGKLDGVPFDRKKFVKRIRTELAFKLNEKKEDGRTYYETISRGNLNSISKSIKEVSLKSMQRELLSDNWMSYLYNEIVSDLFKIDIYILDYDTHDVRVVDSDMSLHYKGRRSIVILYIPGHYETIGLKQDGVIRTLFKPDDPYIIKIRKRMKHLTRQ